MKAMPLVAALTISANVINQGDALEPSILNEVDHALDRVPPFLPGEASMTTNAFATNGLSASAVAIRIVSSQRADGRWFVNGTNATAEAVRILNFFASRKE